LVECGNNNQPLDKEAAAESFDKLMLPKYNVTYKMSLSKSIISKLLAKMLFVRPCQ